VPDDIGSDSDGSACNNPTPPTAMAVTAWVAAVQSRKKISRREVQWLTVMLMARQRLVLLAMHQNLRSRKHKALARTARTQHGDVRKQDATDSDSSQSASESDVTQDNADLDAHADSGSDAIAETLQVQTRCRCTGAQVQVLVRTRVLPCHQAALASASVAVHA
jgi:hypothetical protein